MNMNKELRKLDGMGFTLIELMIVIAIIGILAAIAIPNFIAYRNKSFCSGVESDANNLATAIGDYFSIPTNNTISDGSRHFIPTNNAYTIIAPDPNTEITIQVDDASGRCPPDYTSASPFNVQSNKGWIDGDTYQVVIKN